ncbi:MAG: hypothetical protein J3Q66DRAFT_445041 [Benniella sp.]|nr:MAG: hypothetical protein J3Q66DRAFT_445041 [Benniella sp.]
MTVTGLETQCLKVLIAGVQERKNWTRDDLTEAKQTGQFANGVTTWESSQLCLSEASTLRQYLLEIEREGSLTTATPDYHECLKQIRQAMLAGNHVSAHDKFGKDTHDMITCMMWIFFTQMISGLKNFLDDTTPQDISLVSIMGHVSDFSSEEIERIIDRELQESEHEAELINNASQQERAAPRKHTKQFLDRCCDEQRSSAGTPGQKQAHRPVERKDAESSSTSIAGQKRVHQPAEEEEASLSTKSTLDMMATTAEEPTTDNVLGSGSSSADTTMPEEDGPIETESVTAFYDPKNPFLDTSMSASSPKTTPTVTERDNFQAQSDTRAGKRARMDSNTASTLDELRETQDLMSRSTPK